MNEDIEEVIEYGKLDMESAIDHLKNELTKIRAGKASPSLLDGILVDYYGSPTPLKQVANVGTSDARTISVQPWEKAMIGPIEKAIFASNLGLTPQNNGEMIIINIPPLTEDRRKEYVKRAKAYGEDAKVSLRNARHKIMDAIKKAVKDGFPEDEGKRKEEETQKVVNDFGKRVNELIEAKEKSIMTV